MSDEPKEDRPRRILALSIAGGVVLLATTVCMYTVFRVIDGDVFWDRILIDHFPAIIGIPAAAGAAFVLVVFLRQIEGPIEIELSSFKLKGSAGQILLWAICFVVLIWALRELWQL